MSEFLEWRSHGIGASDIAGILGISPWSSPYSVWSSKVLSFADSGGSEAMRWGTLLEDAIRGEAERRLLITTYAIQERCEHRLYPWARATVDARYVDDDDEHGVLEIKTTAEASWNQVPAYYEAQVQWQMEVTDSWRAWLACLHNGRKLSLWSIERDVEIGAKMLEIAAVFWRDHIEAGVPPIPDGKPGTTDAIAARFTAPDIGATVELDSYAQEIARLREVRDHISGLGDERDALENKIKDAIGDAGEIGTVGGLPVATWKTVTQSRINNETLRARHPAIADEVTETKTYRRFLLKPVRV